MCVANRIVGWLVVVAEWAGYDIRGWWGGFVSGSMR